MIKLSKVQRTALEKLETSKDGTASYYNIAPLRTIETLVREGLITNVTYRLVTITDAGRAAIATTNK
jgi:hypothetical protein